MPATAESRSSSQGAPRESPRLHRPGARALGRPSRRPATAGCTSSSSTATASRPARRRRFAPRTAPHPHRPRLDASHEGHRRRRRAPARRRAILDGEVVVLAPDGTTSFADLQAAFRGEAHASAHLLRLRPAPSQRPQPARPSPRERKAILERLFQQFGDPTTPSASASTSTRTAPPSSASACQLRAEGIVSKRADAPYAAGRAPTGSSASAFYEQEFVIGGFTLPSNGPPRHRRAAARLLRARQPHLRRPHRHRLHQKIHTLAPRPSSTKLAAIEHRLSKLRPPKPPRTPSGSSPGCVAQVRFATWTAEARPPGRLPRPPRRQARRRSHPRIATAYAAIIEPARQDPRPSRSRGCETRYAPLASAIATPQPAPSLQSTRIQTRSRSPPRPPHPSRQDPRRANRGLTKQQLADYYCRHRRTHAAAHRRPSARPRPLPGGLGQTLLLPEARRHGRCPPASTASRSATKKGGALEPYLTLSTARRPRRPRSAGRARNPSLGLAQ